MRKTVLAGIAMLAAITSLHAQEISGKFGNYNGEVIKINIGGCDQAVIEVNPDGTFVFNPQIREPGQVFTINLPDERGTRIPVLVGEGQRAVVNTFTQKDGTTGAKLSGDRAALNTYLFMQTNQLSNRGWTKGKEYGSFAEYSRDVDRLDRELDRLLSRVKGDREIVEQHRLEKGVDVISYKMGYGSGKDSAKAADPEYVAFMQGIDLNDNETYQRDSRKGSLGYAGVVQRTISWYEKTRRTPQDDPKKAVIRCLDLLDELVTNQQIKNNVSHYYAVMYFIAGGDKNAREFVDLFCRINTDPEHLKFVRSRPLPSEGNDLSEGAFAPDFEVHDTDGNVVRLSDLKGKMVYMDVWATWCGPCVAEIPHMEKLYERYKDNDKIVLVSVSLDDNHQAWRKKLAEDNPGWPQYIADGGLKSALCGEYMIIGIPRFMMFDEDGRIISINAMRPSSDELVPFIEQQLAKPKEINVGGMKLIRMQQ